MSLASDYFLLYHGLSPSKHDHTVIDEGLDDEYFFETSALILSLNRRNLEKALGLKSFNALLARLTDKTISHPQELYDLQYSLIGHVLSHKSEKNLAHLHKSFNYLSHEDIISKEACEKLVSLFDPSLFKSQEENLTVEDQRHE